MYMAALAKASSTLEGGTGETNLAPTASISTSVASDDPSRSTETPGNLEGQVLDIHIKPSGFFRTALSASKSLESTIWQVSRIDVSSVACCHSRLPELGNDGLASHCSCDESCWVALAKLLCFRDIYDQTEQAAAPMALYNISHSSMQVDRHQHSEIPNSHPHECCSSSHDQSHKNDKITGAAGYLDHGMPSEACHYHKELATAKNRKYDTKCACSWIKGTTLAFSGGQTVSRCCDQLETEWPHSFLHADCLGYGADSSDEASEAASPGNLHAFPGGLVKELDLIVTGMTCTTCEKKLIKALKSIDGVVSSGNKAVRTNYMKGRATVWYDPKTIIDVKTQVCDHVRKSTGFNCVILSPNKSTQEEGVFLDLLRIMANLGDDGDRERMKLKLNQLAGVSQVVDEQAPFYHQIGVAENLIKKLTSWRESYRKDLEKNLPTTQEVKNLSILSVTYDPHIIGARSILRYIDVSSPQGKGKVELVTTEDPEAAAARQMHIDLHRLLFLTLLAVLFTIPILVIIWSPDIKTQIPSVHDMNRKRLKTFIALHTTCFVLGTIVQLFAFGIYQNAYRSLFRQKILDMDCLVTLSTMAAYIYSCIYFGWNIHRERMKLLKVTLPNDNERERHDPIFETSALLITLILLGRCLTGYLRVWANNKMALGESTVKSCRRCIRNYRPPENEVDPVQWKWEDLRLLEYKDVLLAEAGDSVVTDGVVVGGQGEVDESHLTGEAKLVQIEEKSIVTAGSKVVSGVIHYRITRLCPENTVASMRRMVNATSESRPRAQDYADKVATWLTPLVMVISVLSGVGWFVYYRTTKSATTDINSAISKAVTVAIAVLAISCPCAIALAVPTVLMFASKLGSKNGIVIKSSSSLEMARSIRYFVTDKTGTITTGNLQVTDAKYWINGSWVDESDHRARPIKQLVAQLIARDPHLVARAVLESLQKSTTDYAVPELNLKMKRYIGKGVEATLEGRLLRGGKPSWTFKELSPFHNRMATEVIENDIARTHFGVVDLTNNKPVTIFALADTIRPEASGIVHKLQRKGIEVIILSGDSQVVCAEVARSIGVPPENVYGNCSPEDKALHIKLLQEKTRMEADLLRHSGSIIRRLVRKIVSRKKHVLFIGDGTNDAAALTQADIGVTMSNCTEIAANCADVGILSSSLEGVLAFIALGKRASRFVRYNFLWALKYNVGAILIATGVVRWSLPPRYAGIGEFISVAPVFIIASGLLWRKLRY